MELRTQFFQPTELVAHDRRPLVLESLGELDHLPPQEFERGVIGTVEKGVRQSDALLILLLRTACDARAEALAHLVADAAGRARCELEEFDLIGKAHVAVEAAVAQAKRIAQLTHRIAQALRTVKGPEVGGGVVGGATHDGQAARRPARQLHEGEMSRVALQHHIESRTEALDQAHLQQERGELARHVFPVEPRGFTNEPRTFLLGKGTPEVAQQTRAHALRLADVDDLAVGAEHAVYAWAVRCFVAYVAPHAAQHLRIGGIALASRHRRLP